MSLSFKLIFKDFLYGYFLFKAVVPSHLFFFRSVHLILGQNFSIIPSHLLAIESAHLSILSFVHNFLTITVNLDFFALFNLILS